MSSISAGGVIHDLVSQDEMRRMVGEDFSESKWNLIALGRDKVPRSEIMDAVQATMQKDKPSPHPSKTPEQSSPRSEAIMSFLLCCDRGGKQLLATFPLLGPRKGGAGADHREGTLRNIRDTSEHDLRRCLMEIEARLCMADQRGVDVDLGSVLTDKLLVALSSMAGKTLTDVCDSLLKFASADKGSTIRQLGKAGDRENINGGSDETKVLIKFVDRLLALIDTESRLLGCRLVGHSFQLITGLIVDKCPSAKFAQASGGKVFDNQEEEEDISDIAQLEGASFDSKLVAPLRHEMMVAELKERGNRCMKKGDYSGAVAAYTSALGKGLWVEQAMELVEAMAEVETQEQQGQSKFSSTQEAVQALLEKGEVDAAEKDLLLAHAKTAAALLANKSMAFLKMGNHAKALEDAKLCLRCAPTWPKAHFRIAAALKLSGRVGESIQVLESTVAGLSVGDSLQEEKWVKDFRKEILVCKKLKEEGVTKEKVDHVAEVKKPLSRFTPTKAEDWKYSDIMSPQFTCGVVFLMLLAGYMGSLALLSFAFSMSIAAIFGAPDPAALKMKASKPHDGIDGLNEEEEEGEYETEAGILLSQWMAGGSGTTKGMPQRQSPPSNRPDFDSKWLPPTAAGAMRAAGGETASKPSEHAEKISKLTKID